MSRCVALRSPRPELLERRIVLNHAPVAEFGDPAIQVAANQSAINYGEASSIAKSSSADGSPEPLSPGGSSGLASAVTHQSPTPRDIELGNTPALVFDSQPIAGVNSLAAASGAARSNSGSVSWAAHGSNFSYDNDHGADALSNKDDDDPRASSADDRSELEQDNGSAAHVDGAGYPSNVSVVPTHFTFSGNQSAAAQVNQATNSLNASAGANSSSVASASSAPATLPAEVHLVNDVTSQDPSYSPPILDRASGFQPVPTNFAYDRSEPSQALAGSSASISAIANASTPSNSLNESLRASIAMNFNAVDRALASALEEIEKLGDGLAEWIEEPDASEWAAMLAVAVLAGGGYGYWLQRRVIQRSDVSPENPSSWLFTPLYIIPAQP